MRHFPICLDGKIPKKLFFFIIQNTLRGIVVIVVIINIIINLFIIIIIIYLLNFNLIIYFLYCFDEDLLWFRGQQQLRNPGVFLQGCGGTTTNGLFIAQPRKDMELRFDAI